MPPIVIHTDGACRNNPGPGGYGIVVRSGDRRREFSGAVPATTNNRMEMLAAIRALELLKSPGEVELYTDSSYLKNGITQWIHGWIRKGWRTSSGSAVKNVDLWQRLHALNGEHQVSWRWLKGHAGHADNERCDALAVQGVERAAAGVEDEIEVEPGARPAPAKPDTEPLLALRPGRNLELKLRVADAAELRRRAQALGAGAPAILEQEDVYFAAREGRLKLRSEQRPGRRTSELIHYDRADRGEARLSCYNRLPQADPEGLRRLLAGALGERGVVKKKRELFLLGRTRLHLDRVQGLGDFAELELVLKDGETPEDARAELDRLLERLGLKEAEAVAVSYIDLLASRA